MGQPRQPQRLHNGYDGFDSHHSYNSYDGYHCNDIYNSHDGRIKFGGQRLQQPLWLQQQQHLR